MPVPFQLPNLGLDFGDTSRGGSINNQWNFGAANAWPFAKDSNWVMWVAIGGVALGLFFMWKKR